MSTVREVEPVTITVGRMAAEVILPELASGVRTFRRELRHTQRDGQVEISGTPGGWRKRLAELALGGEWEILNDLVPQLDNAGTRWAAMLDGEVNLSGDLVTVSERVEYLDRWSPSRDVYLAVIEPHFGHGLARG